MRTTKPKDYKGETFGVDNADVQRSLARGKELDFPWPWFVDDYDKKREIDEIINMQWGSYNWDMSLRDKPIVINDAAGMEVDDDDDEPVVSKNATTEPRMRAVDRLKGRRK